MEKALGNIGFITFLLPGLSYLGLGIYLAVNKKSRFESRWLILAIFISALWSLATAAAFLGGGKIVYVLFFLETLRGLSWAIFFALLLSRIWTIQGNGTLGRNLLFFLFSFVAIAVGLSLANTVFMFGYPALETLAHYSALGALTLCIIIFLLVENLYRNSAEDGRWGIKLLVLAVAVLYIYDFLIYADSLLFSAIGGKLFEARGMVNFLIVPVLAVAVSRNPTWKLNIKLSRKAAFHTITLVGTGAYLIGMSAAGYFLQNSGGKWGDIFQISFILVALLGLVVFISSGKFRALTQVLLSKHFFQYRYDYREEWLKLITIISETGEHYDLRERVIKSLADVMDSSGGALWLREQPDVFHLAAKWNFHIDEEDELSSGDEFIDFLEQENWIVDLNSSTEQGDKKPYDIPVPSWLLANSQYWLILPLNHLGKLVGFVVLLQPRVKNDLNWESTDLLKTIGHQLASYLAEQIAEKSLAQSREFESFNRKFAFVVHDIKNLMSQLSLIVTNAEKYAKNPDFQQDMLLTVQDSVKKMNRLLSRITVVQEPSRKKIDKNINIGRIIGQMVESYHSRGVNIIFTRPKDDIEIYADEDSIGTIFMHLIENAREACDEDNIRLEIAMSCEGDFVIIRVKDNGHGMEKDFIKNELFRPFRSTKKNGYGIGAYESREMIKQLGGRLEVKSTRDIGTTMKVYLRRADKNYTQQAEGKKR